jgi:serine/threonine protein kinase
MCPTCGDTNLVEVKRDAFIGRTLADRYQVESLIGTGGMGVVYRAWQEGLKRSVAIKVLRQQFLNDEMSVKRFQQEAIAASRLQHPNIVALHDYGSTDDGYLFMVMDIVEGRSLAQEQREKKTIGVERTIKIIAQVCEALEHAHRNGVVHRDLKPGNIMLMNFHDDSDYVKLVDFGIAKLLVKEDDQELTQKGDVFGSPLYMSPEQCLGMDLDGRSDIYSVGAVLYEALTGDVPHMGKNIIETIDKQIHREPQPFNVKRPDIYIPERLEAVVMKALAKDPADRQQSMKELATELQASVPRKTEALNLRSKIEPARQSTRKNQIVPIVLAVALLLICGWAGFKFIQGKSENHAPSYTVPPPPSTTETNTSGSTTSAVVHGATANPSNASTEPGSNPPANVIQTSHSTTVPPTSVPPKAMGTPVKPGLGLQQPGNDQKTLNQAKSSHLQVPHRKTPAPKAKAKIASPAKADHRKDFGKTKIKPASKPTELDRYKQLKEGLPKD